MPIAEKFLLYAQKLISGRIDHLALQPFADYKGVPTYMASFGKALVFFAVQDAADEGISVTVMLALRRRPCVVDGVRWNGADFSLLRDEILMPRLQDYLP